MFERSFQWTMRHGARLLFCLAAGLALLGAADTLMSTMTELGGAWETHRSDAPVYAWVLILQRLFMALSGAVWPLFGALVIHRWDRIAGRPAAKGQLKEP